MKRFFAWVLVFLMCFSMCGCGKKEAVLTAKAKAAYVTELISEIGEVSYTSLSAINRAENFYRVLTDDQKALVTNSDVLTAARASYNELTSVPKQGSEMFDRSKLQFATYCYRYSLWNDTDMQKLVDAGIDFICGASYYTELFDLCEKHGVGVNTHYLPWGVQPEEYESYAASFVDHPAIWAFELVDEPSSVVFPLLNSSIEKANELFPEKLVYACLFPNYANMQQMGVGTYAEYIAKYVEEVNTDFINYDHYMYSQDARKFLENIEIVADACRENGRDLWIVVQASDFGQALLNTAQIEAQAYLSLAYGAKVINWACWTAGWWLPDNQIVDSKGNYTSLYDSVKAVNGEIKAFSDIYSEYVNIGAFYAGQTSGDFYKKTASNALGGIKQDVFTEIAIEKGSLVAGYFEKPDGSSYGLLLTNVTDLYSGDGTNTVSFNAPHATKVTLYTDGGETVLTPGEDGAYSFELNTCGGAFITVERDEKAVLDGISYLLAESVESAFKADAVEFGANLSGVTLTPEFVSKLSEANLNFVIGNASTDTLKALQDNSMGIFASNFYDYISPAYSSLYGYGLTYIAGALSAIDAGKRVADANLLLTVSHHNTEIEFFALKSGLNYLNAYIPAISKESGSKNIIYAYFSTLKLAAESAKENEKSLYVTVQTGVQGELELFAPTAGEIKWQIYNALAFGARKVILSEYSAMSEDTLSEVWQTLADISAFKDIYGQYTFESAYGYAPDEKNSALYKISARNGFNGSGIISALSAGKSTLFGILAKADGEGKALVIVPGDTASTLSGEKITYTVTVTLDGTQKKVTLYSGGTATELTGSGNTYTLTLTSYDGVFVTIE